MCDFSSTTDYKILKLLNEQRKIGQYCDVTIKLNNNILQWAHFCIIAPQSDFIGNKYFQQEKMQFSIHNPLEIEICNFNCEECLNDVIDYLYCNDVTIFDEHAEHIDHLCKILCIPNILKCNSTTKDVDNLLDQPKNDDVFKVEEKNDHRLRNAGAFEYKNKKVPSQSKMHSCPGCNYKCYRPAEMLIHLTICDTANTKCPLCDTYFETLTEFKGHITRHDNAKAFYCNDCNLRFTTKTALYLHTPKHSSETPHMCPHCGRGFKWKHGLNSHLIVHSSEKKLLCDECGYSTSHLKTLRTHQLSHTGFVYRCTTVGCPYTSRRKENLKIHIATHTKETPFVCEICGYRFSQSKNLKRHALLHISKDLHKCLSCTFSSYRTDKLKEHIARVHTEKPSIKFNINNHNGNDNDDDDDDDDDDDNADDVKLEFHSKKLLKKSRSITSQKSTKTKKIREKVIIRKKPQDKKNKIARIKKLMPILPKLNVVDIRANSDYVLNSDIIINSDDPDTGTNNTTTT